MLEKVFTRRGRRTERLATDLARTVAEQMVAAKSGNLSERLRVLAEIVTRLDGVEGAMLVAFDEDGNPRACAEHQLPWADDDHQQAEKRLALRQHCLPALDGTTWSAMYTNLFGPDCSSLRVMPVKAGERFQGALLVRIPQLTADAQSTLEALARVKEVFAWALQEALRSDAFDRMGELQKLASEELDESGPNMQNVVRRLAELFDGDVVTILLEEQGKLRLAASTERDFASTGPVVYESGEGLTGRVFQTGQALCLINALDPEEIRNKARIKRSGPLHPESIFADSPVRFLGVPMRCGKQVKGVLRISRRLEKARFSYYDEQTLQFFGNLLGTFLGRWSELLLATTIMESTCEAIAVSRQQPDEQGLGLPRVVLANTGMAELLGQDLSEILGMDARKIFHPEEYKNLRAPLRTILDEARNHGRSELRPLRTRIVRTDGSLRSVMISYRTVVNPLISPPIFYTIGLARDITDFEQRQQQHQHLFEMLNDMGIAYFRTDKNGINIESTAVESKITGYSQEELYGFDRRKLYQNPGDREKLVRKVRKHGGRLIRARYRLQRKGGTFFSAEGDLRLVKDIGGAEIGMEGLYQDVTHRLQLQGFVDAEKKRILMDDELFQKLKENAMFHLDYLTSLGHQLQTPLASLVGNLRNLQLGITSYDKLAERLPYAIGQAVVCARLIRNFSFMDEILRDESFERQRVSMVKLTLETKLDFNHLLKERRLNFVIERQGLARYLDVQGHRGMLRQVIVNLVDNAIKYSIPGTIIAIHGYHWRSGRVFEISNQGLPIPVEYREEIFRRGFRTEQAKALIPHSTGLGLWLVRKIVEAHGAQIKCHAAANGEMRNIFRITFPH
ncbi:MAG: PAS domain S-box protein [bacterium]|nr:PAS domain S-box protein [bacterium]